MSLFRFLWLRRFVRKNTKPIPENKAHIWRQRLALGYAFLAWNAFGFVCYMAYKGKADWMAYYGYKSDVEKALSPAQQWSRTLGIENAKVIKLSGFKKVKEFEIHNEFIEEEPISNVETVEDNKTAENNATMER